MQRFTRRLLAACAFFGVLASTAAVADSHPTLRAMSGATPTNHLPAGKSALLVIDFQNEYFTGKMPIPDGAAALAKTRELIAFASAAAPLGYNVIVASDASATRAITRANGVSIDKDSLHKAALAEVEDTFGDVLSSAQIVQLPVR